MKINIDISLLYKKIYYNCSKINTMGQHRQVAKAVYRILQLKQEEKYKVNHNSLTVSM